MKHLPEALDFQFFQYADDITASASASTLIELEARLAEQYNKIKRFCTKLQLKIYRLKAQCLVIKLPTKKIDSSGKLNLMECRLKSLIWSVIK